MQLDTPTEEEMYDLYLGKPTKKLEEKLYCYKDTAASDKRIVSPYNNFFSAFFEPYSEHGDIFLVPDDIWLMISLYLSTYIDSNAEKLRKQFVHHEGQKKLTIVEYANSL